MGEAQKNSFSLASLKVSITSAASSRRELHRSLWAKMAENLRLAIGPCASSWVIHTMIARSDAMSAHCLQPITGSARWSVCASTTAAGILPGAARPLTVGDKPCDENMALPLPSRSEPRMCFELPLSCCPVSRLANEEVLMLDDPEHIIRPRKSVSARQRAIHCRGVAPKRSQPHIWGNVSGAKRTSLLGGNSGVPLAQAALRRPPPRTSICEHMPGLLLG
jgi:hypothetical protein